MKLELYWGLKYKYVTIKCLECGETKKKKVSLVHLRGRNRLKFCCNEHRIKYWNRRQSKRKLLKSNSIFGK